MVDGVGGDGEGGAGGEVAGEDCDARAWRDEAGEAEGGGAVDAEGFGDDVVEAGGCYVNKWGVEGKSGRRLTTAGL